MKNSVKAQLDLLIKRYPELAPVENKIAGVFEIMRECYENGGKLVIGGNGGSCSDAEHIVGELMKGFCSLRPLNDDMKKKLVEIDAEIGAQLAQNLQKGLPAVALSSHPALNTAFLNDVSGDMMYAQQVNSIATDKDVLLAMTTSGNAKNLRYAAVTAKAKGMKVVALTGKNGGVMNSLADVNVIVPNDETYQIQELHLPIYHCLCLMLEEHFFG